MKKSKLFLVSFIFILVFLILFVMGCSFEGIHQEPTPTSPTSPDSSAIEYMEYMYNDSNGERITQKVTNDPIYATYGPEIEQKINQYLENSFVANSGLSTGDPSADKWYKKVEFKAKNMAEFLNTSRGERYLESYLSKSVSGDNQGDINPLLGGKPHYLFFIDSNDFYNTYYNNCQFIYNSTYNNYYVARPQDLAPVLTNTKKISEEIKTLSAKLDDKLDDLNQQLTNLQVYEMGKDFEDSQLNLKTWLSGAETRFYGSSTEYRNYIRDDLIKGIQYWFPLAYKSAVDRTQAINTDLVNNNKSVLQYSTLFKVYFTDMIGLKNMYKAEFTYLPTLYTGSYLKRYRADRAIVYLEKVWEIKQSVIANYMYYTSDQQKEYLNEVYAFLIAWEIELLAHIEVFYGPIETKPITSENASNYKNGFGTFGSLNSSVLLGNTLRKNNGTQIVDFYFLKDLSTDLTQLYHF